MPHQPQISLALAYLTLATNRLLAGDEDAASARLFAGVECLEFCSQLCGLDTASDDAVAEVSVAELLAGFGSEPPPFTVAVAVFVSVPVAEGDTVQLAV